ncbi:MAG: UDP-glucuronic acid decarboxylase family protein [Paracoccaceae bacterium]
MVILVTGGAGFIGSHLCEALLKQRHEVICLDNFFTGSKQNVVHLMDDRNFEIMRHDITMPFSVEADFIFNLACPASPVHYSMDPVKTVKSNVFGALNVLELGRRLRIPVFQASTSEVYGDPEVSPQPESYSGSVNPIGPRACYDEGKRCAETLFYDYHRQYGVDVRVARIFNTYGPRMQPNDGRVVSNFIMQALQSNSIGIYGDGSQTRSFCFVDDLVCGLLAMMREDFSSKVPINLGRADEITIKQLASKICSLTNSDCNLQYLELPSDDPRQRCPDVRLAKEYLNWEASTPLEHGLEKTIEYFRTLAT